MLARFEAAVLAAHPDLVLWQVGTNSVMRDHSLAAHAVLLREGLAQLKEAGVRRVSAGTAIAAAAYGAAVRATKMLIDEGKYDAIFSSSGDNPGFNALFKQ